MVLTNPISLQMLTVSMMIIQRQTIHKSVNNALPVKSSYDYIVVGAGSAGAAVAYRLTEDPDIQVLLIEAGGPQSEITDLPGLAISLWKDIPLFDWGYKTVPQKYGLSLKQPGVFGERRGKVTGGTSTINGLIHGVGNPLDYDEWAHKYGAHGWAYADVLPYLRRLENNTDPKLVAQNFDFHGTSGPIYHVSDPEPTPLLQRFQEVYNELGYETIDVNGAKQLGTAFMQMTIKNGYRCGTGNGYLEPNRHPNNLHILTDSFVTKVNFLHLPSGEITATGVEFVKHDVKYIVNAKYEVILSAGVFNSPQVLMLSGVGPKAHLQLHGIPLVADLPVGSNLQDHPKVVFQTVIRDQDSQPREPELNTIQLYDFVANRTGPLARYSCLYTFFNTINNTITQWPNIVLAAFVQKMKNNLTDIDEKYGDRVDEWKKYYQPYLGKYYLRTDVNLRKPRSFGSVRLASADPFKPPLIDPNFFDVQQDLDDIVEAAGYLLWVLWESPISKYLDINRNPIPGCQLCPDKPMYACKSYIQCYIRLNGEKELHPVGTCRMGAPERPDTVVDPTLKVKGISKLRICDASVMPTVPNGNTNTPSIMIGEKCADLVKHDLYLNLKNLKVYNKK